MMPRVLLIITGPVFTDEVYDDDDEDEDDASATETAAAEGRVNDGVCAEDEDRRARTVAGDDDVLDGFTAPQIAGAGAKTQFLDDSYVAAAAIAFTARWALKHLYSGTSLWPGPLLALCAGLALLLVRDMEGFSRGGGSGVNKSRDAVPQLPRPASAVTKPNQEYRPTFRWQVPLPSSAPNSRTVTTADDNGSASASRSVTGTDVTGVDEVYVSVRRTASTNGGGGGASVTPSATILDDDDDDNIDCGDGDDGSYNDWEEGGRNGQTGDGLRCRTYTTQVGAGTGLNNITTTSSAGDGGPQMRKVYMGRPASRVNRIKERIAAKRVSSRPSQPAALDTVTACDESTFDTVTSVHNDVGDGDNLPRTMPLTIEALCSELGLASLVPRLAAEALTPTVLRSLALKDAARARAVLLEAGIEKLGHREAILLAVTQTASPPKPSHAAAKNKHALEFFVTEEAQVQAAVPLAPTRGGGAVRGVRNPALRRALGDLALADEF